MEKYDLSQLQGDKNVWNKYDKKHTRRKVWTIVIICLILSAVIFIFAKSLITYTLTFDTMGGTKIESVEMSFLQKIERPKKNPRKRGYYLAGWTKDKEGKEPFMFGSQMWWSTTIYAKWEEGVAIELNFADGEENEDLSTAELKEEYEEWVKIGVASELPLVYNTNVDSVHYGERLLWFEDPSCSGDPIFGKTYTLSDSISVYGKWYDCDENKFNIASDGTLRKYLGYCKNIVLPSSVKYIRDISRKDFLTGTSDQLHDKENDINFSVFESVIGRLETIYLNDGLLRIGNCAFKDCGKLKTVKCLGDNLLSIGEYAFEGTAISTFKLSSKIETIGENAFNGARSLKTIEIGESVTEIEDGAFASTGLISITLPKVAKIGKRAFAGCNSLTEVYFLNSEMVTASTVTIPEMGNEKSDNVFFGTASPNPVINALTIYVPEELLEDYKESTPWNVYASYIRGIRVGA